MDVLFVKMSKKTKKRKVRTQHMIPYHPVPVLLHHHQDSDHAKHSMQGEKKTIIKSWKIPSTCISLNSIPKRELIMGCPSLHQKEVGGRDKIIIIYTPLWEKTSQNNYMEGAVSNYQRAMIVNSENSFIWAGLK